MIAGWGNYVIVNPSRWGNYLIADIRPGLAQLTDPDPPAASTLRTAARAYQRELDKLTQEAGFAA